MPEAWEKAVLAVWDNGIEIKTQYDRPDDPPSKDATVMVTVANPFAEPRIHKNFPGGPEELEAYRQEVVDGIHDHWIDAAAGKWTYTYHERLVAYSPVEDIRNPKSRKPFKKVNQIQYIIDSLSKVTHTRRAQAITWMPTADPQPTTRRVCSGYGAGWLRTAPDGFCAEYEHALAKPGPLQGVVYERLCPDRPAADNRRNAFRRKSTSPLRSADTLI